jgi:hypothetical protein
MNEKIPQTQSDLERQLDEQLRLMELSAQSFDAGFDAEAKRLALSIRVLLHDTRSSYSLLGQLDRKNILFYDSSPDYDPANLLTHGGLVAIAMQTTSGSQKAKYIALLDEVPMKVIPRVDLDTWWNKVVFVDLQRRPLTRKELVLTAADQDGGAHVDPNLDQPYADLSRSNSLAWHSSSGGTAQPMDDPTRAAIRQISHEILKSLKKGYTKKPDLRGLAVFTGATAKITAGPSMSPSTTTVAKVGRNDPCPCGSGKKYKRCCGR